MNMIDRKQLDQVLEKIAEQLDLDETRYENAERSYKAIGNWLDADQCDLAVHEPRVYPQGSFALGTVVKPINSDEYDVDCVCHLSGIPRNTSPKEVKKRVGDRFREHKDYTEKLEEKNRCWRINYAGDFHLDVIPAISDEGQAAALLVPDKSLEDWSPSAPEGYARWFRDRMAVQYMAIKAALAEATYKSIDEIPDHRVKTPLQRVVQLLKRQRDMQFGDDDDKPISIAITTLAAHAYANEASLYDALISVAKSLRSHLELRDGAYWIGNPANPLENFADKWQQFPKREAAFCKWLDDVENQIGQLENCTSLAETEKQLYILFGEQVVSTAIKAVVPSVQKSVVTSQTFSFDVPHRQKPRWPIVPKYEVSITARTTEAKGYVKGVMPRPFYSGGTSLPKGIGLEYCAVTNAPRPYEILWQVVNTGSEAEAKSGLRGKLFEGSDHSNGENYIKIEATSFTGRHWIEAFVIQNGLCVARSGEFVITID